MHAQCRTQLSFAATTIKYCHFSGEKKSAGIQTIRCDIPSWSSSSYKLRIGTWGNDTVRFFITTKQLIINIYRNIYSAIHATELWFILETIMYLYDLQITTSPVIQLWWSKRKALAPISMTFINKFTQFLLRNGSLHKAFHTYCFKTRCTKLGYVYKSFARHYVKTIQNYM